MSMKRKSFEELVEHLINNGGKYNREVYFFIKAVLDYSLDIQASKNKGVRKHVSGQDLLEGFRAYTLKEFGPMSSSVLREWGIKECEDVGVIVFELIEVGVFGKDESDSPSDFSSTFTFKEAFETPFMPIQK